MDKIIEILNKDGIVALPTDTVYGLIGNPFSEKAVEKAYNTKRRNKDKPLSIFLDSREKIKEICITDDFILDFIDNKLKNNTIILEKKEKNYLNLISSDSIGIRIPNNKFIIDLLKIYGKPVFATSINFSGEKECLNYNDVFEKFSNIIDFIVKDGDEVKSSCKPSSIFSYDGKNLIKVR